MAPHGAIQVDTAYRVLGALRRLTERATRRIATGRSHSEGRRPEWLRAATNLRLTGFGPDPTVFPLEAPHLARAAPKQFGASLFRNPARPRATALDFAADAVRGAQSQDAPEFGFDYPLLRAVVDLARAHPGSACELSPGDDRSKGFLLDAEGTGRIARIIERNPRSQAVILTGRLDVVRHRDTKFELVLDDGERLPGRLVGRAPDRKVLRDLWGRMVTVVGVLAFRPGGDPGFLRARQIAAADAGDEVFRTLPKERHPVLWPLPTAADGIVRPRDLLGAWPGDEPIEELLAMLD